MDIKPGDGPSMADQKISAPIPNQEVYMAKIDNTIAAIEEQNLQHDPRYTQLNLLKNRLAEGTLNAAVGEPETPASDDQKLSSVQLNRLKAQINAYKMLARNEPVPKELLNQVTDKKIDDHLPLPYQYPLDLGNGEKLPYDLTKILSIYQCRSSSRTTTMPTPPGIDPKLILKERENRYLIYF